MDATSVFRCVGFGGTLEDAVAKGLAESASEFVEADAKLYAKAYRW